MRSIGTIPDGDHAERFSDYLVTRDIDNRVEQTQAGDFAVWVENDDHLERAKGELLSFLRNPDDPQYRDARKEAEKIRVTGEKKQRRLRKRFVDVRTSWGQPKQWAVPLTIFLIAASLVVGALTRFGRDMKGVGDALSMESREAVAQDIARELKEHGVQRAIQLSRSGGDLAAIRHGQVWRLVTPIFLHFGILHLVFNMFWLRDLGGMIELRRGTGRLALIVVAAAVFPNLAQYFWAGPFFGGMSGVVYALFGYVWIKGRYEPQLGLGVSQETVFILLAWLVLCMTGWVGDIANAAHVAGLVVGVAIAYAPIGFRRLQRGARR